MDATPTEQICHLDKPVSKGNFFKRVTLCKTQEDVIELLYQCLTSSGLTRILYFHFPHVGSLDYDNNYFTSFPPLPRPQNSDLPSNPMSRVSDVLSIARLLNYPITAKQALGCSELSQDQKERLAQTTLPIFPNALIVPLHGAQYRNGIMLILYENTQHVHSEEEIRWAQWLSDAAHKHISTLLSGASDLIRRLTEREREILKWVAKGKSNSVTADIIGISQHTVNGYLRSIYLKTGTSERTGAVLRCIGEGLLDV